MEIDSSLEERILRSMDKATSFMVQGLEDRKLLLTETSPKTAFGDDPSYVSSVYIPSYIVHSLGFVKTSGNISAVISEILDYLKGQMEANGTWRFFGKQDEFPPPDFDDTCCALAALKENNVEVETDVWSLLSKFRGESGLYYTWIDEWMNKESSYHIDGVVNTNILYFASVFKRKLPEIIKFIDLYSRVQEFYRFSIYSVSEYSPIYLISRAYGDGGITELDSAMLHITHYLTKHQRLDGSWGNPFDTILALASLANAKYAGNQIVRSIEYLLKSQEPSGGFPSHAFFKDFTPVYYGSPYLTTAIFLETMSKLLKLKDEHV